MNFYKKGIPLEIPESFKHYTSALKNKYCEEDSETKSERIQPQYSPGNEKCEM
jgi:hypothetical protein